MGDKAYLQYGLCHLCLYSRINDLGYYKWYQSSFNPKKYDIKIMFDWICVVCYSMGKYVFFTDECMLIHGLGECRKCHGESICGDVLMCGVFYGVIWN